MRNNIFILLLLSIFLISCDSNVDDVISSGEVQEKEQETVVKEEVGQDTSERDEELPEEEAQENEEQQLDQLSVHYIDVGQGDATLFEFTEDDEKYTILYDVGDWQGNEVVSYLQHENINFIDLIIISHPHADHIGQLDKVIDNVEVGEVWMSGNSANTNVFQSAMEAILNNDIDYDEPTVGDVFDIGPLELVVLHPESLTSKLNEDSLSIHFTYGNVSFLFTGDAYVNEERMILQRNDNIQADFLQLGHHGSNTSTDPMFVEAVDPTYAIYSAGEGNSYGHPHEEVVNLFASIDIPLYGTDVNGTIIVTTDGVKSDISTTKDGTVKGNKNAKSTPKKETKKAANIDDCININEATSDELQHIIHIGEVRAKELIDLRPFESIDDLTRINGIGPARIADIKAEGNACGGGS